jgi:hypothetical protein
LAAGKFRFPISAFSFECTNLGAFDFDQLEFVPFPFRGRFGSVLLAVFQVSTTLLHLHLPPLRFVGTDMDDLLRGLAAGKGRLKTLNFNTCNIEADNFVAVGRGLEHDNNTLEAVLYQIFQGHPAKPAALLSEALSV